MNDDFARFLATLLLLFPLFFIALGICYALEKSERLFDWLDKYFRPLR